MAISSIALDKFKVFQTHRSGKPYIGIGEKGQVTDIDSPKNPIKRALYYKGLLDSGKVDSQEELAIHVGTARSRVSHYLALLKLDDEIKDYVLSLDDERLKEVNERKLRPLTTMSLIEQKKNFAEIISPEVLHGKQSMGVSSDQ